jgi:putative transposase
MKDQFPILALCDVLDVSRSGYYNWADRLANPSPRARQNQELAQKIKAIHKEHRQTYGSPRIARELRNNGHTCGRNRAARIMRQEGIYGRQKGRFRVQTTDSAHDHPIAPNLLAAAPKPTAPNQQWVADITYIQTSEGWLYLAAILDLYSRKIVGWAMSERIDTALVLQALAMALLHRQPPASLLFHSDRGVQYACGDFRAALAAARLVPSMSRKGNCYDNAVMESFWSTLKLELIYRTEFQTRRQAQAEIFDYIETFYNRKRIHSALNYLSPVDFELQNN